MHYGQQWGMQTRESYTYGLEWWHVNRVNHVNYHDNTLTDSVNSFLLNSVIEYIVSTKSYKENYSSFPGEHPQMSFEITNRQKKKILAVSSCSKQIKSEGWLYDRKRLGGKRSNQSIIFWDLNGKVIYSLKVKS